MQVSVRYAWNSTEVRDWPYSPIMVEDLELKLEVTWAETPIYFT